MLSPDQAGGSRGVMRLLLAPLVTRSGTGAQSCGVDSAPADRDALIMLPRTVSPILFWTLLLIDISCFLPYQLARIRPNLPISFYRSG